MSGKKEVKTQGGVGVLEKRKVERPRRFKVILHNDDYTPMGFVIQLIIEVFQKNVDEATQLTLTVHYKGKAVCGVYPRDLAESKVNKVMMTAKEHGHPLLSTMEAE